ncbi:MAG: hypothetical protein PVF76_15925 [Syntrophobacterales bacterium]
MEPLRSIGSKALPDHRVQRLGKVREAAIMSDLSMIMDTYIITHTSIDRRW